MAPRTRYARNGDVSIAYQVVGDGPIDLVHGFGFVSHLEYHWEEPGYARYLRRLATFSRLILFDKRGTGLSDRAAGIASMEERMDDVRAVMDAAGSARSVLLGASESAPLACLFAAPYPQRRSARRNSMIWPPQFTRPGATSIGSPTWRQVSRTILPSAPGSAPFCAS